jgi:hypothetical protein
MRSELEPEEVLRGQGGRLTVAEEELAASEPAAAASTSVAAFSRRFPRKKKSISRESEVRVRGGGPSEGLEKVKEKC